MCVSGVEETRRGGLNGSQSPGNKVRCDPWSRVCLLQARDPFLFANEFAGMVQEQKTTFARPILKPPPAVRCALLRKPGLGSPSTWSDVTRLAPRSGWYPAPLSQSGDYTSFITAVYALPGYFCAALWPIAFCLPFYCRLRAVPDPIVFALPAFPAWRTRVPTHVRVDKLNGCAASVSSG